MDELTRATPLDVKAFNSADAAFHRLAISASGNRFLLQASESLHVHIQLARHYQGRSVAEAKRANVEHRHLVAAIADGDGGRASEAAREHIDGVLNRLQTDLDTHDGDLANAADGAGRSTEEGSEREAALSVGLRSERREIGEHASAGARRSEAVR